MKHLSKAIALAAVAAVFASCSKDENLYQGPQPGAERVEAYNEAFIAEFGESIDPSQNWGFYTVNTSDTRAAVDLNTGWTDCDANEWWKKVDFNDIPKPVDNAESARVHAAFLDQTHPYCDLGMMNDFFCQQVFSSHRYYKVEHINSGDGSVSYTSHDGSACMDYLVAYSTGNKTKIHSNNFNASKGSETSVYRPKTPYDPNNGDFDHKDSIMFVHCARTDMFSYHDSYSHAVYSDYKIKEVDGQYYLGFHYIMPKTNNGGETIEIRADQNVGNGFFKDNVAGQTNDQKAGDPIYDDWIIKVTPAPYKTNEPNWEGKVDNGGRVMAEDLGATGDWDFNDVVFDVVYTESNWIEGKQVWTKPVLTLRACGGTLPLTVAGIEVHEAFGVATNVMVNTGAGPTRPVVTLRLADDYGGDLAAIPVVVTQGDGSQITLAANTGKPASKFLVPTSTRWMKEYKNIKTSYPDFASWVGNATEKWWNTVNEEDNLY